MYSGNNKRKIVKNVVLFGSLTAILVGGFHLVKEHDLFGKVKGLLNKDKSGYEEIDEDIEIAPQTVKVETDYEPSTLSDFTDELDEFTYEPMETIEEVDVENTEEYLSDIALKTEANITEISSYMNSKDVRLQGDMYLTDYVLYGETPPDQLVLMHFGERYNDLIKNAYGHIYERRDVQNDYHALSTDLSAFIMCDTEIIEDDYHVSFTELSPITKIVLLNMDISLVANDYQTTEYNLDAGVFTQEEVLNATDELLTENNNMVLSSKVR